MKTSLLLITCLLATTLKAQTFHWAKPLGGTSDDQGRSVTTDASGNVYTTGIFKGTGDFNPGTGVATLTSNGGQDVFVQKMDAAGNFLWAKSFGGSSDEYCHSIAIDAAGNVYTTGSFGMTVDFDPGPGTANFTSVNGNRVFIQKMDASGNFVWAKACGGIEALSIFADASGNIYTTGDFSFAADFDPGPGTTTLTPAGDYDIFVQKMDVSGNLLWAKALGGSGNDFSQSVKTDASGNVYITGYFTGTADFDPGAGVANRTSAGGDDIFVQKMDASGNFIWAKSFGGTSNDHAYCITVDASGNACTTGNYGGVADFDPGTGTANLTSSGSFSNAFIQKMDDSGNYLWAKSFGGTNDERGYSITQDASGNVYAIGYYSGTVDFDPGPGTLNLSSNASLDLFIVKLSISGGLVWAKSFGGTSSEIGYGIAVDTHENVYTTGWFAATADFDPGTGTANLTSAGGGDVFVQKLRQCLSTYGTDVVATCGPYTWINGITYTASNNTATHILTNAATCDSIITLNLTILSNTGTDVQTACNSYTWIDGNTYTSSNNTATHTLTNTAGCDSVVTLNLTILSNTGTDVQTACDSYTWIDGNTYTASNNTATHTLTNAAGCDSVVTLNLTINHSNTGTDVITACNSYTWIDGNTYTASNNTATHTLTNAAGCDSVVTLNLTILHSSTGTDVQTTCDSYTWIDGNTYTASNSTATHTLTNAAGCDSVVTLQLTITHSNTGTDLVNACDSYTWIDGNTYTTSNNTATHTLTNAAGCDSVVTLQLTIHHFNTGTDIQNACNSYTWIDGNTYTASNNTATHTLTNAAGCDSVVTLQLTIHHSNTGTDIQNVCNSYTWIDGITYTASNNTATYTLTNAAGCDSVITLNLTIQGVSDTTTVLNGITIHANNDNATYQWLNCDIDYAVISGATNQNFTATANGNYAVQLTENGCTDTSACVEIKTVGIPENDFGNAVTIYPNPTEGKFFVDFGTVREQAEISIMDITGKIIETKSVTQSQIVKLTINEPAGFYLVSIRSGEREAVFKVIKE
ncbi:SBBP repeat-containing protein [Fluviicola sp.]|uniref:SBBP repeat-containing protein n=1 Tax=Fluviicola sp. TaxID=1917219 RepID=UPI0031D6D637